MWHGGDAHLVRDELCGNLTARCERPRTGRCLLVVLRRGRVAGQARRRRRLRRRGLAGPERRRAGPAGGDGRDDPALAPQRGAAGAHLVGRLDQPPDMLTRRSSAPAASAISCGDPGGHARGGRGHPGDLRQELLAALVRGQRGARRLEPDEVRRRFLRPALAQVFDAVVLRYSPTQRTPRPGWRGGHGRTVMAACTTWRGWAAPRSARRAGD